MTVLSVPAFGAGVVKEGSADSQRTDELSAADSYDIEPRGQLVAASDVSDYGRAVDEGGDALSPVFGMFAAGHPSNPMLFFIGSDGTQIVLATLAPTDGTETATPLPIAPVEPVSGTIITWASFPYVNKDNDQVRVLLVSIAARASQLPNSGFGLYVITYDPSGPAFTFRSSDKYDALGTGNDGEFPGGNKARVLAPRGVVAYSNHAFIWGFDSRDSGGDGPTRLMFSNLGNPLKWGRDPDEQAIADGDPETNRTFEDSDAIELGGSGEAIRSGYVWRGKLWIGTNRELHYVEGFGRESFKTNGAIPLAKSRHVIGANAMIEGPDGLLYGMSDRGLWVCDGAAVLGPGDKLRDFDDRSVDWWDLIWSDPSASDLAFPGQTNQDLVWMLSQPTRNQVWVVIPYCNAAAGFGAGVDTVVIKYHVTTGGFTRQVFPNRLLLAGSVLSRETLAPSSTFLVDSAVTDQNVLRYGYRATPTASPVMPEASPDVVFGPYAPFGPNGVGVERRKYLTIAWEPEALPLRFSVTEAIDGRTVATHGLTIATAAPASPANGDLWVDTSGSDTSLGTGTPGTIVGATPGVYFVRQWKTSWNKWVPLAAGGSQQGTRMTIPIVFPPVRGSRFTVRLLCVAATGRYQLEQFGDKPALIREAQ